MAPHSSTLAWKVPWTEEPGGLQSMGSAVTNLGNPLKSRDVTLLAKGRIVKAMLFLVVIYGCESWTIKKAEC